MVQRPSVILSVARAASLAAEARCVRPPGFSILRGQSRAGQAKHVALPSAQRLVIHADGAAGSA
jgi:hypothetical protein